MKHRALVVAVFVTSFVLLLTGTSAGAVPPELVAAAREHSAYPDVADDLAEADAYRWQRELVEVLYGDAIAGLKAGLTSAATQRRFGVSQPVLGVLPSNGAVNGGRVALVPGLKIELEVGFRLAEDASARAVVFPAIEFPRQHYTDMSRVTFADIVATNVSAYRYILGAPRHEPPDLAVLHVVLMRDGEKLSEGTAADALGDPDVSADWMVAKAKQLGYPVRGGWVLITGALGPVVDAVPGHYRADFGVLGSIEFTIEGD